MKFNEEETIENKDKSYRINSTIFEESAWRVGNLLVPVRDVCYNMEHITQENAGGIEDDRKNIYYVKARRD